MSKYLKKISLKNILKKLKKYASTNILFLTYVISSFAISILLRLFTIGNISEPKAYLCDLLMILVLGSFGYLIKPKHQFKYFLTMSIIFTTICVVNKIYYDFYTSFVSFSMISTLSYFGEVSDSLTSKLKLGYFIYLLAPVILIYVNSKLSKRNYYFEVGRFENGKRMWFKTFIVSAICVLFIALGISKTEVSRLVKLWNRDYVVQRFGIYTYMATDLANTITPSISPMFGYDEASRSFINYYNSQDTTKETNKYTNIFEGKNVIFIHMESIQNFLIDLTVNGEEITPNLNKIVRKSLYFSKFYPQISVGTSSDTEFTLSTGLLPSTNGTVFVNYYNRTYETIQKSFKYKGYYTFSMHANSAPYWNRETMYKTLGYDEFYSKEDFDIPEDETSEDLIGLGLSDKSFYKQIIPILQDIKANNNNYMGTIISLSNHSPFNDVTKYGELNLYEYLNDTDIGNYLRSAHYADAALGELFTMLEENNLMENTVFIMYGDHESKLGKSNLNLLYNYDINTGELKSKDDPTYINLDNYGYDLLKNTPLIIYSSETNLTKQVNDVMGMYDVYPTVANMFNLDYNYALGHDIFSSNEKIVIFPNGDIITNYVFYNNLKDEYISLNNEPIDSDYINRIKEYRDTRLEVSKAIIVHDLINKEGYKLERNK